MVTTRLNIPTGSGDIDKGFVYDPVTDRMVLSPIVKSGELLIDVKDAAYGAKGDVRTVADAVVSGQPTTTVTSATAAFTQADVGKLVTLNGAGASGAVLATTVATVVNSTTITVATTATTNVSAALLALGTDDSTAMQAAINAANAAPRGGVVYFPPGVYARGAGTVTAKLNVVLRGAGMDVSTIYAMRTGVRLLEDPNLGTPASTYSGIEDLTLWGFADRTATQGGDPDRLTALRAERIWFRRVHALYSRSMSLAGIGGIEGRAENCVIERSYRDGINLTGSGRAVCVGNSLSEIGDDGIAFHVSSGLATGTVLSPQTVIVGNRFEKCAGIKVLGATSATITGNSGQFMEGYGIYVGYDGSEGNKDTLALTISGNTFRDIIDLSLLGGGVVCRGIWLDPLAPAKGALAYWPGLAGPGTGTAPVVGPLNGVADRVGAAHSGAYGVNVVGNTIIQTLEGLTTFSDAGFGSLWWSSGPINPTMTGTIYRTGGNTSTGISLGNGAMRDTVVQNNTIYGVRYGFILENLPVSPQATFRANRVTRVHQGAVFNCATDIYGHFLFDGNEWDIDPLFEASEREKVSTQPNGHWAWVGASSAIPVYSFQAHGIVMTGNVFKNSLGITSTAQNVYGNVIFADTSTLGVTFGDSGGVTVDDSTAANNWIVQYNSDPRSTTYGQVREAVMDLSATAMPTTGAYVKNQFVKNRTPTVSAGKTTIGWLRLTNGTAHVANTDWAALVVPNA